MLLCCCVVVSCCRLVNSYWQSWTGPFPSPLFWQMLCGRLRQLHVLTFGSSCRRCIKFNWYVDFSLCARSTAFIGANNCWAMCWSLPGTWNAAVLSAKRLIHPQREED